MKSKLDCLRELLVRLGQAEGPLNDWSDDPSLHFSSDEAYDWSQSLFSLEWSLSSQDLLRNALRGSLDAVAAIEDQLFPYTDRTVSKISTFGSTDYRARVFDAGSHALFEAQTECLAHLGAIVKLQIFQLENNND